MKSRSTLLAFAVASLFATAAMAQNAMPPVPPPVPPAPGATPSPPPPPPPMAPMPPMAPAAPMEPAPPMAPPPPSAEQPMTNANSSAQMQTPQGNMTVNSGMPPAPDYGPRPSFSQLDTNHNGRISKEESKAYLLLYNDWINVAGHGSSITKAEYARWDG